MILYSKLKIYSKWQRIRCVRVTFKDTKTTEMESRDQRISFMNHLGVVTWSTETQLHGLNIKYPALLNLKPYLDYLSYTI
ncbi:unnamed protein product [Blepharisma stoltei]|uniref:Uncharacterized protein n=1 Tax=Blepharisma stoltei TaxID=1481888 RepID=A0AAU9JBI5_9CILI|nr:unnamed protein product [Blepharisma stoltei]